MALFELQSPRRRPSQKVNAQHQQPSGFRTGGPKRMLVVNNNNKNNNSSSNHSNNSTSQTLHPSTLVSTVKKGHAFKASISKFQEGILKLLGFRV